MGERGREGWVVRAGAVEGELSAGGGQALRWADALVA